MARTAPPRVDWPRVKKVIPPPAALWHGIWGEVGERCGKSWDVWAATHAALSALASRNLFTYYVKGSIYGMAYNLIVAPTGTGKEFPIQIVRALLPKDFNVRGVVQSGQALYAAIYDHTDPKRKEKPAIPTMMSVNEWTEVLTLGKILNSTLHVKLNKIFNTDEPENYSTSEKVTANNRVVGGDKWGAPAQLSIFACTTPRLLLRDVTEDMVSSGFINRYLILPGPTADWDPWPDNPIPHHPTKLLADIREKIAPLRLYRDMNDGENYQHYFTDEAKERFKPWLEKNFLTIMREESEETERKKRLHLYAHQIALLSAWTRHDMVQLADVEMAIAAVDASHWFVDFLWGAKSIPLTVNEEATAMIEEEVRKRIRKKKPGYYDEERLRQSLRKVWKDLGTGRITKVIRDMRAAGEVIADPHLRGFVLKEDQPQPQKPERNPLESMQ